MDAERAFARERRASRRAALTRRRGRLPVYDETQRRAGSVPARLEIPEFPVAPGGKRRHALVLPKLKPGRYVALALLDYGGAEIAAGQHEFEVR